MFEERSGRQVGGLDEFVGVIEVERRHGAERLLTHTRSPPTRTSPCDDLRLASPQIQGRSQTGRTL
jgi:hypothetical protein